MYKYDEKSRQGKAGFGYYISIANARARALCEAPREKEKYQRDETDNSTGKEVCFIIFYDAFKIHKYVMFFFSPAIPFAQRRFTLRYFSIFFFFLFFVLFIYFVLCARVKRSYRAEKIRAIQLPAGSATTTAAAAAET